MIEPKQKPCKGQMKSNGVGCGKLTLYRTLGLCSVCYREFLLNDERGKIILSKSIIHAKKETKKKENAFRSDLRHKLKTLGQFEAEAKKVFQRWVRLRDESSGCVSCPTTEIELFDGGHYKKAEIYSGVIFDERNCHKQCRKCNRFLGGNELMFREGLIKRYGLDFVNQLEIYANLTRNNKYTREELIEIKRYYAEKIRNKDFTSTIDNCNSKSIS